MDTNIPTHILLFLIPLTLLLLHMCNVSSFWLAFVLVSYEELFLLRHGYRNLLDGWATVSKMRRDSGDYLE